MKAWELLQDPDVKAAVDKLAELLADKAVRHQDLPICPSSAAYTAAVEDTYGVTISDVLDVDIEPFGEWVCDRDDAQAADLDRDRSIGL